MFDPLTVIIIVLIYAASLFLIALWVERKAAVGKSPANNAVVYSLSLAVYCTAWTYYGSVGIAAKSGLLFLTIYLGPTILIVLWWTVLRKLVRIKEAHRITSIADFISARYGKSEGLAAIATLIALVGIMPYIALQLRAVFSTFEIITNPSTTANSYVGPTVVLLMIAFTIVLGVRRLDPTERHEAMVMALAAQCVVKLVALLAAGIFVTYFVYDGFSDIFQRLSDSPFQQLMSFAGAKGSPYLIWTTYLILAMSAILFLPRQFHIAVVENSNEKHILTAMWLFPLYLLLINLFVFPIAAGGLLQGHPREAADTFVLQLPIDLGESWLAILVFIGGISAATGMIMISSVTLSTMITNHLFLPLVRWIKGLSFLRRHLLECKWVAVAVVIMFGYWFEQQAGESYMLVKIGLISFAAVLQFAPAVIGGLFWRHGNKGGAYLGLSAGFLVWFYTLLLPSFIDSGLLTPRLLETGPWGMAFLKPEKLLGLSGFDRLSHTVFWTMFFNVGLYVLGSLYFRQNEEEQSLAEEFVGILAAAPALPRAGYREAYIDLATKMIEAENLLGQYFTDTEVAAIMAKCCRGLGVCGKETVTITELVTLHNEVEKYLAGAIGAPAAHKAMRRSTIFTPRETKDLMDVYRELLADFRVTPEELKTKIDYYQEKEALLTSHAQELKELNKALELRISEQIETEKALAESEEKYRSIFENAPEGIFRSTREGRFIDASPSMAHILGYDSPQVLIDSVTDIPTQLYVDPQQRDEHFRLLVEEGRATDFESKFYRKDQSVIWVSIRSRALLDKDGNFYCLEGFVQNISKRKRAEEELQQAYKELEKRVEERTAELQLANEELLKTKEAAETATRAKSEFLANMSHEIRTPMNGVIAATELALNEKLPPKIEHYMKIIHSSAYSLLGIINDILDFSKIEAGKLELETGPFRLDEVLDGVTDVFINKAGEKRIELLVDIDPQAPRALIGDPLRLQQIIKNLIDNAIKFTPKSGVILVGVEASEKSLDAVMLTIFVKDTGVGIAPEHVRILFKPFTQADASTTRKYGGTGLGLSICKQLVEMMGGEIGLESELGAGSTFTFTARFDRQPADQERQFVAPRDIQGLPALVVDDSADNRTIILKMLESFGFKVASVSGGQAALKRLQENEARGEPFRLAMMDWLMPDLDGIETARIIRQDLKMTLPIILMTAFGKETERLDAERAGINGFLTKPIYPSPLFNAIMDAFGKEALAIARERKPITTKASIYKKRLKGSRILVAEDNLTNQEIAMAVLEGAGILVEVANNGAEAVEAVRNRSFDAVLMDIQMPEMDGYEATRIIREDPQLASLPIIAMTAHAMKGDEEKCLRAGMDAYVSKPINQDILFHTLWKSIKPHKKPAAPEAPQSVRPAPRAEERRAATVDLPAELPGINIQDTLEALNIDQHTFKRILEGFRRNNQDTMATIKGALEREDWETVRQLAHSLKGSAANIGANRLHLAAKELETASADETARPPSAALIDDVAQALNQVLESLGSLAEAPQVESLSERMLDADPAKITSALKQLAEALELADPQNIKRHMKTVRKHLDGACLQDLESHISDYEYDEALASLRALEKRIQGSHNGKGDDSERDEVLCVDS